MGAGGVYLPPIATANVCLNPRVCMHHRLTNTTLLPSVLTQSPVVQGTLKHEDYFALGIIDNIFFFKVLNSLGASPSGKFNSLTTALRLKTKKHFSSVL